MKMFKKNKKGFSLIELIVVMGIMAILVLIAVPKFLGYTKDAKITAMQTDSKVLSDAVLQYGINNDDEWPIATTVVDGNTVPTLATANEVLTITNFLTALDVSFDLTATKFAKIEADKLSPYIKKISDKYENYYLVIEGDYLGDVFYFKNLQGTKEHADGSKVDFNGIHQIVKP